MYVTQGHSKSCRQNVFFTTFMNTCIIHVKSCEMIVLNSKHTEF